MSTDLIVVGLSHHTAPLSIRERVAMREDEVPEILAELAKSVDLPEAVLISTCNRVELMAASREPHKVGERFAQFLDARTKPQGVEQCLYRHVGENAANHLFRVASGLDSMVLGEPQILGQVKAAFNLANNFGLVGTLLRRCFDRSFKVAKRVRTETEVAVGNVSVSSIACELAEKIFGSLQGRRVLLVGAGKMSEVAARSLTARGASLYVVNRNRQRAEELAKACNGTPRPLEALAPELAEADVVISSTAKDGFVITHELMQGVCKLRRWRPLFIIDIAVPRDVDPRVDSLRNVFVYDMDDLQKVSRENLAARERALGDAQNIIAQELSEFERWRRAQQLTPTIVALRQHVRATLHAELEKALPRLSNLPGEHEKALRAMCEAMTNQLLHSPLTALKQAEDSDIVEAVQRLFSLNVDQSSTASDSAQQASTPTPSATELVAAPSSANER